MLHKAGQVRHTIVHKYRIQSLRGFQNILSCENTGLGYTVR